MSARNTASDQTAELALEDPVKSFSTGEINQMLWNRYTEKGEHVFLFDVPNIVGVNQARRCDGVAIGMWGSSGRLIQGFEVKASRSDWLREVKDVTKADPFVEQCDRWWLVTGHVSIAKPEEIPAAWGWMVATKTGLRIQRPASPLPQPDHVMKRLWAFALIRRAAERGAAGSTEFKLAVKKETDRLERMYEDNAKREINRAVPKLELMQAEIAKFEKDSGMKLGDWKLGNVGTLAKRLAALKETGYGSIAGTLDNTIRSLNGLVENAKALREALDCPQIDDSEEA